MKKSRLIVTLMLVALLVTSIAIPAMAATTTNNEVNFDFDYGNGVSCGYSDNSIVKQTASQWMFDVTSNDAGVSTTYAMLWTLYSDWDWCVGSRTYTTDEEVLIQYDYINASQVIGWEFLCGAMVNADVLEHSYNIQGNWNPDIQ